MKINTMPEFHGFINELDLESNFVKNFLYNIFANKDRDFYILDLEKRKVIQTSQTFSLDSDWFSHIEEITLYELYLEYMEHNSVDTVVLTFRTLKDLRKAERFIKDNFKFLKKEGMKK